MLTSRNSCADCPPRLANLSSTMDMPLGFRVHDAESVVGVIGFMQEEVTTMYFVVLVDDIRKSAAPTRCSWLEIFAPTSGRQWPTNQ